MEFHASRGDQHLEKGSDLTALIIAGTRVVQDGGGQHVSIGCATGGAPILEVLRIRADGINERPDLAECAPGLVDEVRAAVAHHAAVQRAETLMEATLTRGSRLVHRAEVRRTHEILRRGEELVLVAAGALQTVNAVHNWGLLDHSRPKGPKESTKQGVLLVTDQRLVFFDAGIWRRATTEFPIPQITSITTDRRMLMARLRITGATFVAEIFQIVPKERAAEIVDYVTERLKARDASHVAPLTAEAIGAATAIAIGRGGEAAPTAADPIEQIRRLAELRDAGAITPDEFEAKKSDLLRRL